MTNHPKKRFSFASHCVIVPNAVARTAEILITAMYLTWASSGLFKVQSAAGDCLAGRIEKQEVKGGFFSRIALAAARLAPGSTQDPPAQIEVNIPMGGGTKIAKNQPLVLQRHNIRQYMSYKM
jgi:hypothetical protein